MVDFFENIAPKIGVTADQFKNLSGPQALQAYFNGLEKANLSQAELTFYMEAIASESTALIPLLRENGKGFAEAADRAEKLGFVLSDIEVASLDALGKSFAGIQKVGTGFINKLLVKFSPILIGIFNDFEDLIVQAGGFQKIIDKVFSFAIRGAAFLADGIRGIQVAFVALQGVAGKVLGKITNQIGEFLFALGDLSGNDGIIKASKEFKAFAEAGDQTFTDLTAKAQKMSLQILPSEIVKEKVAEYKKFGDAVIKENARIAESQTGQTGSGVSEITKKQQQEIQNRFALLQAESVSELALNKEKLDQKLVQNTEFLLQVENLRINGEQRTNTLIEDMRQQHGLNMQQLEQNTIDGLISQQIDYGQRSETLARDLQERQNAIDSLSAKGKKELAFGAFREALSIAASGSKKLFELNKKFALAEAVVNGFRAIQAGFATQPFFPVGIAMGALAAVKTATQIQGIKSTSFSGGGKTPSAGGGSVALPSSNQTAPPPADVQGPAVSTKKANLTVVGDLDSREKILNLARDLVELRDDGFTDLDIVLGAPA